MLILLNWIYQDKGQEKAAVWPTVNERDMNLGIIVSFMTQILQAQ